MLVSARVPKENENNYKIRRNYSYKEHGKKLSVPAGYQVLVPTSEINTDSFQCIRTG